VPVASTLDGATVLVAAGGTGGHLQPALAVAAEARSRGARVVVVTTPSQVERVREQYTTYALELKGFERRVDVRAYLRTFRLLAAAVPRVRRILREARPDVAVGGGGFASGPVVAVAALSGVPGLALEADAHLGVANRLLRPFVRRFCLSFPIERLEPPRYVVTGRPLGPAQLTATPEDGREVFALDPGLPVVLAFGGSQGARSINRACVDAFGGKTLDFQLVHVCGPKNEAEVRADLEARGERFERYRLIPYTDRLAAAMAAADLVVARSGGSVAELAALGKPAILVPYPYATADHQRKNAREMVAGGAALLVDDAGLDGDLLAQMVGELLGDPTRLAAMAAASAALGRPDAARRVADQIEDVMTNRRGAR
jgi:UDP-N-acetylglucosamine--N-acetylmuramyl-(pentapeptide) pyrophosphoryl-undecaprenol N-acetylglucosamine transferase